MSCSSCSSSGASFPGTPVPDPQYQGPTTLRIPGSAVPVPEWLSCYAYQVARVRARRDQRIGQHHIQLCYAVSGIAVAYGVRPAYAPAMRCPTPTHRDRMSSYATAMRRPALVSRWGFTRRDLQYRASRRAHIAFRTRRQIARNVYQAFGANPVQALVVAYTTSQHSAAYDAARGLYTPGSSTVFCTGGWALPLLTWPLPVSAWSPGGGCHSSTRDAVGCARSVPNAANRPQKPRARLSFANRTLPRGNMH
eukprot:3665315-Rhodomonas_salina.1